MPDAPATSRRVATSSRLFLFVLVPLVLSLSSAASGSINVDGLFEEEEWEGAGPLTTNLESPWSPDNDLQALFAAWDSSNLYLATVGYSSTNNVFVLFVDSSTRTTGADVTNRYRGFRAIEAGWDPDFLYTCVEMQSAYGAAVCSLDSAGVASALPGALHASQSPYVSANGIGVWEIAIPWSAIGTEPNGTVRVAAGMGWATSKHDPGMPLGGASGDELPPGRDGNEWVLDEPFRIDYDRDGDGVPDAAGVPFASVPILFRYQAPEAFSVHFACEQNGWSMSADPMTGPDGEGWWTLVYPFPLGLGQYKFVVNGSEWESDPLNPLRVSEYGNSAFYVSAPSFVYFHPLSGSTILTDSVECAVDVLAPAGDSLDPSTIAVALDGDSVSSSSVRWDSAASRARVRLDDLADGDLSLRFTARTAANAFFAGYVLFTVRTDTIPPAFGTTTVVLGDGGRSVRLEVEATDDDGMEWVRLYVREAGAGAFDSTEAALGRFDVWHAEDTDIPGGAGDTLVVRFAASDGINRSDGPETRLVLPEDGTDPSVEDHFFAPAVCAPGDTARLSFRLSERAGVDLVVEREGAPVTALARDTLLAPGYHAFLWDGRDSLGAVAAAGTYAYRIAATDPSGNEGSATGEFAVDGAAPDSALKLILLFHANQTLNYRGDVANDVCFRGILEAFEEHPTVKAMFHFSGTLLHDLAWFEGDGPGTTLGLLREGARRGQYEIVGSTYAQNVPYGTHDWDNGVQVEAQKAVIESLFALSPVSWWNAERCWRQGLLPLMTDHGYRHTWVETHILYDSGMQGDPWEVKTTSLDGERIHIFNDDGTAIGPLDHWIDSGDSTALMGYLRWVQSGNRFGTRVVCYCQDAEATGLWDFEGGGDPAPDWENLEGMLAAFEETPWIETTTFSDYLERYGPVEEISPVVDGQANWMVGPSQGQGWDDWFDYNAGSPMLAGFRAFFDTMRAEVQTMEARAAGGEAMENLIRHARRNYAAHQFEFACIGCGNEGCQDWRKMETIGSAAEAARVLDQGTGGAGAYRKDVNRDGAEEALLAGESDLFVFTPVGGRLLYWWDLERGEQLVGNEIFMYGNYYDGWRSAWGGDGWNDDRHYRPDFVWDSWNTVPSAEPFHREYGIRRRALNDRVSFGGGPARELMNEAYSSSIDGDTLRFVYGGEPGWTLRKEAWIDSASVLRVAYTIRNDSGAEGPVRLALENGLSPALLEVMDHGRSSLRYWDGAAESDTFPSAAIGVRNVAAGRTLSFLWDSPPDSVEGGENVFGLEIDPVWRRTVAEGDSVRIVFRIAAAAETETTGVDSSSPLFRIGPNPFRPFASIRFRLAEPGAVTLRVYAPNGRLVRELENRTLPAGEKEYAWDGRDGSGREVASGVYLIRLDAPGREETRKAVLLR